MKITKKYLQKLIEQETKRAINERGPCKGTKRLHSDGKCYYPDEMPCRGTKVRHSDGKCYYPDEVPTKNGQATKQTNPCKGTKVLSKVDGKCYYPDELPDEKALNEILPAAAGVAKLGYAGYKAGEKLADPATYRGGVSKSDGTQLKKYKKRASLRGGKLFASDWKDWPEEAQINFCKKNNGKPTVSANGKRVPAPGPTCREIMQMRESLKISRKKLAQIINEEVQHVLTEKVRDYKPEIWKTHPVLKRGWRAVVKSLRSKNKEELGWEFMDNPKTVWKWLTTKATGRDLKALALLLVGNDCENIMKCRRLYRDKGAYPKTGNAIGDGEFVTSFIETYFRSFRRGQGGVEDPLAGL